MASAMARGIQCARSFSGFKEMVGITSEVIPKYRRSGFAEECASMKEGAKAGSAYRRVSKLVTTY